MILRRLALFVALLVGVAATQVPEFVQQYRQRLGGAIDELAAVVARFESDAGQQNMTGAQGIDLLRRNADRFVRQRGEQEQALVDRLHDLRGTQDRLRTDGPIGQVATLLTRMDGRVASSTLADYRPAVPTTPEGFVFGAVGLVLGGGIVHLAGRPLRRRAARRRELGSAA